MCGFLYFCCLVGEGVARPKTPVTHFVRATLFEKEGFGAVRP